MAPPAAVQAVRPPARYPAIGVQADASQFCPRLLVLAIVIEDQHKLAVVRG